MKTALIYFGIGYLVFVVIVGLIFYIGLAREWPWLCQPYPYKDDE